MNRPPPKRPRGWSAWGQAGEEAEPNLSLRQAVVTNFIKILPGGSICAGKTSYQDDDHLGFWLGIDKLDNTPKINIGGPTYYLKWTGSGWGNSIYAGLADGGHVGLLHRPTEADADQWTFEVVDETNSPFLTATTGLTDADRSLIIGYPDVPNIRLLPPNATLDYWHIVVDVETLSRLLHAADLDAESSSDGQVLTSDGDGHAGWTAAAGGVTDHGALTGLTPDDDHPQYHTDGRADARYIGLPASPEQGDLLYYNGSAWVRLVHDDAGKVLQSGGHGANPSWQTAAAGVTDHGALTGLADDDHSQYPLSAGRAGGQSLNGGNAANDDLTIQGTDHATRTSSYLLLQPNGGNVGIGAVAHPSQKLHLVGGVSLFQNDSGYIFFLRKGATDPTAIVSVTAAGALVFQNDAASINLWQLDQNGITWFNNELNLTHATAAFINLRSTGTNAYTALRLGNSAGSARWWLTTGGASETYYGIADKFAIYNPTLDKVVLTCAAADVGIGTTSPAARLHALLLDAATNTIGALATFGHNSSGTPAAGFGARLLLQLASSTTADQNAAHITAAWLTATHATRAARLSLAACDYNGDREGLRIDTDGAQSLVGFYGHAATAQQVLATGASHTVDDVIAALQALGLVKQS